MSKWQAFFIVIIGLPIGLCIMAILVDIFTGRARHWRAISRNYRR